MGSNASVYQWKCDYCFELNPTETAECWNCTRRVINFHLNTNTIHKKNLGRFLSIEIPHITKKNLKTNRRLKVGECFEFEIPFTSHPDPEIVWFHNREECISERIKQGKASPHVASFKLLNAVAADTGSYVAFIDNGYGACSFSLDIQVVGKPGPPKQLKDKAVTKDTVTLSWQPADNNGGYEVIKYVVEKVGLAKDSWSEVDQTTKTEFTISKLIEGKKYYFRVAAISEIGTGEYCETLSPVVPKSPFSRPGKMEPPVITDVWSDHCTVSWDPPESLGGSPTTAYHIKRSLAETEKFTTVKCLKNEDLALSIVDTKLVQGTSYMYRVFSENKTGIGPISDSSEKILADDPLLPPKFTDVKVKEQMVLKGGINETMSFPFVANPQPNITWLYNKMPLTSNNPTGGRIQEESSINKTWLCLSNAVRGDSGIYKVQLVNEYGSCDFTVDLQIFDPPCAPDIPVIQNININSCTIQWKPPTEDGGTKIFGYFILRAVEGSSRLKKVNSTPVTDFTFTDNSLEIGKQYQYRVAAINKMGIGPPSSLSDQFVAGSEAGQVISALPREFSNISQLQWPSAPHIKVQRQTSMSVEDVRYTEERKALEKLNTIRTICRNRKVLFTDPSFPAEASSLYYDTNGPKKEKESAVWLRPSEIKATKDDGKLDWAVVRSPSVSDIVQGQLGDCWFLSCLAVIADRSDIIEKVLTAREYCPEGVYIATLCKDGAWTTVIIDDLLPSMKKGFILYSRARRRQLWVPLLEKAFAKIYGCYEAIVAGSLLEGLTTLTGAPCEIIDLNVTKESEIDAMWAELLNARKKKYLMGGACGGFTVDSSEFQKNGLIYAHAYSLLDVQEVEGVRLVCLRNPWGHFSWNGDYCDSSPLWNKLSSENHARLNPTRNGEGIFWMPLHEMMRFYDWVDICKYRPDWMETRIAGSFPCNFNQNARVTVIDVFQQTEVDFTLFQESNRTQAKGSRSCADLFIIVFEGDYYEDQKFGNIVCQSRREIEKSTGLPYKLESGTYTIICMAFNYLALAQKEALKYMLTIHSEYCIMRETHKVPPEVLADSLIKLAVLQGRVRDDWKSKGTKVYFLARGWIGSVIIAENKNPSEYMHVLCDCTKSLNLVSTRDNLKTADVIPPMHRQVLMVLTAPDKSKFGIATNFVQKTDSSSQLVEWDPGVSHSPPFPEGLENLHCYRKIVH